MYLFHLCVVYITLISHLYYVQTSEMDEIDAYFVIMNHTFNGAYTPAAVGMSERSLPVLTVLYTVVRRRRCVAS